MRTPLWQKLALMAAATALCLVALEVATRLLLPRAGLRAITPEARIGLLVPLESRDYGYSPGFEGVLESSGPAVAVAINSLGFRDEEIRPGERIDVLAAGDSFTVGYGVRHDDAWPERLERALGGDPSRARLEPAIRVLNAGVSGYSLEQVRRTVLELLPLEPRVVVLGVYPAARDRLSDPHVYFHGRAARSSEVPHLRPTAEATLYTPYRRPLLRELHYWTIEHWQLAAHALRALHRPGRTGTAEADERSNPEGSESLEQLLAVLTRTVRDLEAARVPMAVLLITHQEADGSFAPEAKRVNARIGALCRDLGVLVVDPLPRLEAAADGRPVLRLPGDHHWSPLAHRLAAEAVAEVLAASGLGGPPGPDVSS